MRLAPGVRLDLGATAKAWTADTAAGAVTAATGSGCLVSIGGDIAVAGPAPAGGWRIRVEDVTGDPDAAPAGPATVVTIHGRRPGHLLGPAAPLAARRRLAAPPGRPAHGHAAGPRLAHRLRRRRHLRRRERAEHRRRRPRQPDLAAAPRRPGCRVRLVTPDGQVLTAGGWPEERAA